MKQKWVRFFQVFIITVFLVGSANLQTVLAQDETPVPEEASVQVTDVPQDTGTEEVTATDSVATEAPVVVETEPPVVTEIPTEAVPTESVQPTATETPVETTETVADVVDALASSDLVLVDAEGNPLSLAESESQDALSTNDPWYVDASNPTVLVIYQSTACTSYDVPAGYESYTVDCHQSVAGTPIQDAINAAPDGTTIHLIADSFSERVNIENRTLTLEGTTSGSNTTTFTYSPSTLSGSANATSGGYDYYAWFYISGSTVNLSNMILDGTNFYNSSGNKDYYSGLYIDSSLVTVSNLAIKNFNYDNSSNKLTSAGVVVGGIDDKKGEGVYIDNTAFSNNDYDLFGLGSKDINIFAANNTYSSATPPLHNIQLLSFDTSLGKITICHATNSAKNPFVEETVAQELIVAKDKTTGACENNGHGLHEDDIIPAFTGTDCSFVGQNLDTMGDYLQTHCVAPTYQMTIDKSVSGSAANYKEGDTINYNIVVENTGNVTLHNVYVVDPGATLNSSCPAPTTSVDLDPKGKITCTATHVVSLADVTAGTYKNTATAYSTKAGPVSDDATSTIVPTYGLTIDKSVNGSAANYEEGDTINYDIVVENTGNVTLHNVFIADTGAVLNTTCPTSTSAVDLAAKGKITCTATHLVSLADVTAGTYKNTATADSDETAFVSDDATSTIVPTYGLTIDKSVSSTATSYEEGDTISYDIVVENTSNITLHNVFIADTGAVLNTTCPTSTSAVDLAAKGKITCTATHLVSLADVTAGTYKNTATADSDETALVSDDATSTIVPTYDMSIVKSVTSTGTYVLNSTISYSIVLTNNSNVTLHDVFIADTGAILDPACPTASTPVDLAAGDDITCTASHVVTAADVTAGTYANTASGDSNEFGPVSDSVSSTISTITVLVTPPPTIPVTGGGGLLIPVTGGLIPVTGGKVIVSGLGHSCMTYNNGQVICWGLNASGQLGDSTNTNRTTAVYVKDLSGVLNLTAGSKHTCALNTENEVWCWGENSSGQLGDDSTTNHNQPVMVNGLPGEVMGISAGEEFTCAQMKNQEVWCWGKNNLGQLNDGTTQNQLKPVKTKLTTILPLISGGQGQLLGGDQLGNVSQWANVKSAAVQQISDSIAISANRWGGSGCAVAFDGTVKCWGNDLVSASVSNSLPAMDVGAGLSHDCAVNNDETVSCWGTNLHGELGDGTNKNSTAAVVVKNLSSVHALGVGASHTCVLFGTGNTPVCWGANSFGQLGNNSNSDSNQPVFVILP